MGRRRKVPNIEEEKENENDSGHFHQGPMYTILSNAQLNETFHNRYLKEMRQLYTRMDHDAFTFTFIKMLKTAMEAEEGNEFAQNTLLFCSKFVSSYNVEEVHPMLIDTCKWLLSTISNNPHIRFRLCQFINMILNAMGQEAALDDAICDGIMEYMLERLKDVAPGVRVQAILAMQRLQVPDNPDDPVLRAYQFHLCSDPSPRVRQAVITCMGRNYHTIPYILDRLWDIDEKVRRHTYLHMSSYPVRSYKVSQRLTLLEQGLNDRSEGVRKVVTTVLLQQWIESYQKNLITLISALKLDSTEAEISRFRKITKQTLKEIFKRQDKGELVSCLPLQEDGEFHQCVPHEQLTMEIAYYWECLTEYLQNESAEELDLVVPELSTFCNYVERFCQTQKADMDKFEQMDFEFILLSLLSIAHTFDLGDEIGRGNLQKLLAYLMKSVRLEVKLIEIIVKCTENLITDQNMRMQFFVDIIQDICNFNTKQNDLLHDRNLVNELLAKSGDSALSLKVSSLKVKILDLEEQEMESVKKKDYEKARQITEDKHAATVEYTNLLNPLREQLCQDESSASAFPLMKVAKSDDILKGLQIIFYMVVSPKVTSLTPSVCNLYNDFICRHMASTQMATRDWALQCGTAYGMLYEALAKDVFEELYGQFFKNHNVRVWETSIACIFELMDRYGIDYFVVQGQGNKEKKTGRQLYNTIDFADIDEDSHSSGTGQSFDVIYMMSHFLDTCEDVCIVSAIIKGFCRWILRGIFKSTEIIEKLLLRYFNPTTDPEINQTLGVFLEHLILSKQHHLLQPCLLPIITVVLSAPYDSPLQDIRPENLIRFIIDATRQEVGVSNCIIHHKIALSFLQEMINNVNNKELCKLLAKEIITLRMDLSQKTALKEEMKDMATRLMKADLDTRTIKNIINFKHMLDGNFTPPSKTVDDNDSDDDNMEDTGTECSKPDGELKETTEDNDVTLANADRTLTNGDSSLNRTSNDNNELETLSLSLATANELSHRSLRKSINMTKRRAEAESGPSPSKIRIEARIDSEKKSKGTHSEPRKRVQESAAKKSLDFVVGKGSRDSSQSGSTTAEARQANHGSTPSQNTQKLKSNKTKKDPISSKPVSTHEQTEKRSIRKATTVERSKVNRSEEDRIKNAHISEELNSSDVIPPSPSSNTERMSTRLQRNALRNNTSRVTRLNSSNTLNNATKTAHQSKATSTPVRNGRKRILELSPKTVQSVDTVAISPLRKQMRGIKVTPNNKEKHTTHTQTSSKSTVERHMSGSVAAHSPLGGKNLPRADRNVRRNVGNTSSKSLEQSNSGRTANENRTVAHKTQGTSTPTDGNRPKSKDSRVQANDAEVMHTVITRHSARIERRNNTIMTRKRSSLDTIIPKRHTKELNKSMPNK